MPRRATSPLAYSSRWRVVRGFWGVFSGSAAKVLRPARPIKKARPAYDPTTVVAVAPRDQLDRPDDRRRRRVPRRHLVAGRVAVQPHAGHADLGKRGGDGRPPDAQVVRAGPRGLGDGGAGGAAVRHLGLRAAQGLGRDGIGNRAGGLGSGGGVHALYGATGIYVAGRARGDVFGTTGGRPVECPDAGRAETAAVRVQRGTPERPRNFRAVAADRRRAAVQHRRHVAPARAGRGGG